MAKKVMAVVKLQCPAGQATPSPPVGPALGQHGVNLMDFCKSFNARTAKEAPGTVIPVLVTVYSDKTISFVTKTPPAAVLLKQAAKLAKGTGQAGREHLGKVSRQKLNEIAQVKMQDLNTDDIEAAMRTVEGSAKSMGVQIED